MDHAINTKSMPYENIICIIKSKENSWNISAFYLFLASLDST